MTDDLIISVRGGTQVAPDDLFAEAARFAALSRTCADWGGRARRLADRVARLDLDAEPGAWGEAFDPASNLWRAGRRLGEAGYDGPDARLASGSAAERAEGLRRSLVESAERYGDAELRARSLWDHAFRFGAANLPAAVLAGLALWPTGVAAQSVADLGWVLGRFYGFLDADAPRPDVIPSPSLEQVVRSAGGALDELVLSSLGVPPFVAAILGRQLGAPENASTVLSIAAGAGLLGSTFLAEGPVTVRRATSDRAVGSVPVPPVDRLPSAGPSVSGPSATGPSAAPPIPPPDRVPPPAGFGELARRIPESEPDSPQIRIEQYGRGDDARYLVYVGGTVDFSPFAVEQPMDLTNAVSGVAEAAEAAIVGLHPDASSAGTRAVQDALAAAGASPSSPLIVVGHSAGGTLAASLAADPDLNVVAGMSFGGPDAPFDTGSTPFVSVANRGDLVPELGGRDAVVGEGRVGVACPVGTGDAEGDGPVPAHGLVFYRDCAAMMNGSDAPQLTEFAAEVSRFTRGAPGLRTDWLAERTG